MIKIDITKELLTSEGKITLRVDKEINNGDFITLFGKSGSGKTTLLRILAGLEKPNSGEIIVDGDIWFDSKRGINLLPQKREVGFVFQDYALFPNMNIRRNLEFALREPNKTRIDEILDITDLSNLSNMMPQNLSGGQKQRVALARAIVRSPKILLLDEPLSALDLSMRQKLQDELLLIHEKFGITSILVSHDIDEVFKLSNRVLKISQGIIEADASPKELFATGSTIGKVISINQNNNSYIVEVLVKDNIQNISISDEIFMRHKIDIGDSNG